VVVHSEVCCQLLPLVHAHLPVFAIDLIRHQYLHHVFSCVRLDLFEPVLHGVEGGAVVDGVGHDDAHGPAVVGLRDGLKPLLPRSVPDLHTYLLAVDLDGLDLEVDA
jgi:hypothetical protein